MYTTPCTITEIYYVVCTRGRLSVYVNANEYKILSNIFVLKQSRLTTDYIIFSCMSARMQISISMM